jgi:hypothetical protein
MIDQREKAIVFCATQAPALVDEQDRENLSPY